MSISAAELANKPALIDGSSGRTLTYGQITGAIRLVAASLAARVSARAMSLPSTAPTCPNMRLPFTPSPRWVALLRQPTHFTRRTSWPINCRMPMPNIC
ncbi:MAG: hypothetical protein R2867_08945 [Caldilineaceae bacterium]